jgi:hypothetical protein
VLARDLGAFFINRTFGGETAFAFEIELDAFAAAESAFGIDVFCHVVFSYLFIRLF